MHDLEPYFNWLNYYNASEDENSPFFEREYSEMYFTHSVYNYVIHPQWDDFGSQTLYLKILFVDYEEGYTIIELIGEWNDAINNDIMQLKREIIDWQEDEGINKFILIGENVLNFHGSDDSYYEEWFQEVDEEDGWISFINFRDHVLTEIRKEKIDYYVNFGGELDEIPWRKGTPQMLFQRVSEIMSKRLN